MADLKVSKSVGCLALLMVDESEIEKAVPLVNNLVDLLVAATAV